MHMPYVGPFRIGEVLERDRYRLLGRQGALHLHQDFHVSRLKLFPSGPDDEGTRIDSSYFDCDFILGHRIGANDVIEFRIRWVGYTSADDTWVRMVDMTPGMQDECMEYLEKLGLGLDGQPTVSVEEDAEDAPLSEYDVTDGASEDEEEQVEVDSDFDENAPYQPWEPSQDPLSGTQELRRSYRLFLQEERKGR